MDDITVTPRWTHLVLPGGAPAWKLVADTDVWFCADHHCPRTHVQMQAIYANVTGMPFEIWYRLASD